MSEKMKDEVVKFWHSLNETQEKVAVQILVDAYVKGIHNTTSMLTASGHINRELARIVNDELMRMARQELIGDKNENTNKH